MIKVVIDTSVFVAAILSKTSNTPRQVLESWYQGKFTLIMAPQLLEELVVVLLRRRVSDTDIEDLVAAIGSAALYIPGAYEATRLDRIDPKDNKFLAAAYEAKADYLVSLDNDLLSLKNYHGTQIYTPVLFLQALN